MRTPSWLALGLVLALAMLALGARSTRAAAAAAATPDSAASGHDIPGMDMPGMDMGGMHHDHAAMMAMMGHSHAMTGLDGPYPMTREASGTAWQPDAAPHRGVHVMRGAWSFMLHGAADVIGDEQGGHRGGRRVFGSNMAMGMARRALGPGTLGLRAMLSAEAGTIGRSGYPLLIQTGESADGVTPLLDRQHPHDLFMELAGTWSVARGDNAAFVYAGLPGEPALGPPAYMHRFSGEEIPETPITHHWFDSTHITYGVVTVGASHAGVRLEASGFKGREPDEVRTDLESPKLDSYAFRGAWNPTRAWSLQASGGHLHSPEALEPEVGQFRYTASAAYHLDAGDTQWGTLLGVARLRNSPGHTLDAVLIESTREAGRHTAFARIESVAKDELVPEGQPLAGEVFHVAKAGLGYSYAVIEREHATFTLGGYASVSRVPTALRAAYGENPLSGMAFARVRLR